MTTEQTTYTRITVRRPNGEIEEVRRTDLPAGFARSAALVEKMRAQTRKAGRGEVLTVEWVDETPAEVVAEVRAYVAWEMALADLRAAEGADVRRDGAGYDMARIARAKAAYEAAKGRYLATYGEQGASLVQAREARAAHKRELAESAERNRWQ